jgi:hypothetical protein
MKELIWILAILSVLYWIWKYLIPFITVKFTFWLLSVKIKRMAKRYSGDLSRELKDISSGLNEISKETKL